MYWGYPEDWLDHWRDDLAISSEYFQKNVIYKLIKNEKIIGFCAIEERPDEYEIGHLWVIPEYIGQGYGRFLLQETLGKVIKAKKDIMVVADPNAESFYQKMGFATIGHKKSYPKGRFIPIMRKRPV